MIECPVQPPKFSGEFWLGRSAVLLRPRTRDDAGDRLGGGVGIERVPPTVGAIDVIELEPEVIEATAPCGELRALDPLTDPRVTSILNDARGALALTDQRYGAIVSQPSHPWTAGASHLYTREFLQQARTHLSDGGVFVQWMDVSFLDETLLRSLSATLLDVFGHLRIYRPDPNTLVFLASTVPLDLETPLTRTGIPLWYAPKHYARFGIHVPEDVVAALVADQEAAVALARGAELITDDRNRMATAGAYDRGVGLTPETTSRILAPYDPLQRRGSAIVTNPDMRISYSYLARRIAHFIAIDPGVPERLRQMARLIPNPSTSTYVLATERAAVGDQRAAARLFQESLALDPQNRAARFELVRPWLAPLAQNRAPEDISAFARGLEGSAAAVVESGRHAAAGDWAKVPALDRELRAAQWTDAWYFESVQMRADWRTRVSNPEARPRMGREALQLLDDAVVSHPTPTLYSLRARAAISADRPDVLLESVASFVQGTVSTLARTSERDLPSLRSSIDALIEVVDGLSDDPRVRTERRDQVRANLTKARDQVNARVAQ